MFYLAMQETVQAIFQVNNCILIVQKVYLLQSTEKSKYLQLCTRILTVNLRL